MQSGGWLQSARLAGEPLKNGPAGWDLNKMEDSQREHNQDGVREPGVQRNKMEAFGYAVGVEKLEDVEVEEIEAVAALANQKKRTP